MKKVKKLISLSIAILLIVGLGASCAKKVDIHNPEDIEFYDGEELIALSLEMVPLSASPPAMMFTVQTPTASGSKVEKNAKAEIDYSNSADGYIMVKCAAATTKQLRVIIKGPSGTQYQYSLRRDAQFDVYPLSDGSGSYSVGVFEQIEGTRYATSINATLSVTLRDEFAPFLRPNQYVNFNTNSAVVAKATQLVAGKTDFYGKVEAIYNFVIETLTYDKQQAATVPQGYLPDVDAVLSRSKGICFDFAAVMTAMLRSQDIPTKLVIGYAGEVYHAWINVYSAEAGGWINNVIQFDGKEWKLMDPTFAATGNQGAEVMRYIGDGKNYKSMYLY